MAVELAQAYVSITPSARGIGRTLSRELTGPLSTAGTAAGDSAARNFGSRFTSSMARIGRNAGIALAGGLGTAGFFGVKIAADFEQTRIAFEGILGDVEEANSLLKDLRDFAAKTPFEFTGLAESARSLLAVGFEADEILPTMTKLGNVAATLGVGEAEIKGVVRALGQMRGKGKASAEELQQISEQIPGFSAINAIAEELGITTAKAFDKMKDGAIPADVAIEAILQGMEDFPGAAGAMDRQSKTLNGVFSTFKDTLAGIAIDFITPHLPALSAGVQSAGDVLGRFFDGLQTGFDGSQSGAEAWGGRVHDAFFVVRDFVRDELIPRISEIVSKGLAVVKAWWDENGETVKEVASDVFGSISGVATALYNVIKDDLLPIFKDFAEWLFTDGPGVEIAISGIAAALGVYAFNAGLAAAASIAAAWPLLVFAAAVGLLAWATQELFDKFDLAPKISDVLNEYIIPAFETIVQLVGDAIDLVKDLIELIGKIPAVPGGGGFSIDPTPGYDIPLVPLFDSGGVMPGRRGVHSLAWVAGGETILPTHQTELGDLIGGGSLVAGDLIVQQLPGEDAGAAALRGLRKVRLMVAA
jgi:tape measure domain-containing protein